MKGFGMKVVGGGLGVVPAARDQVDTSAKAQPGPAPRPMKAADAQVLMMAELLQAAQGAAASSTALLDRIGRSGSLNGVLGVELATIADATQPWTKDYPVPVGSVVIVNHSQGTTMTVQAGQPNSSSPPTSGVGVQKVAPLGRLVMPIGDRSVTVWGSASDQISVQAFTGLQPFGVSL